MPYTSKEKEAQNEKRQWLNQIAALRHTISALENKNKELYQQIKSNQIQNIIKKKSPKWEKIMNS